MNLNIKEWKEFYIGKIFRLEPTKGKTTDELEEGDDIPYIGAKHDTQGFMQMCKLEGFEDWVSKGNCIVFVQLGAGSAGYVNYMPQDFIGMNGKTSCGYIDGVLNEKIGMFLETLLCKERPKYSFGRSWTGDRLENTIIKLPIQYQKDDNDEFILDKENHKIPIMDNTKKYSNDGYVPDWKFMEDYIKSLNHKPLTTTNVGGGSNHLSLDIKNWKEFKFGNLISEIYKGKAINKDDLLETNDKLFQIRYITRTAENNGCELLADIRSINEMCIENKNAISIGDTTATCFYQSEKFIVGDHMVIVRANWLNEAIGLYIVTLLNNEQYKYSYGRAYLMDHIKETILKLPIKQNLDGTPFIDKTYKYSEDGYVPDFKFMEDYIKSMYYGDKIA